MEGRERGGDATDSPPRDNTTNPSHYLVGEYSSPMLACRLTECGNLMRGETMRSDRGRKGGHGRETFTSQRQHLPLYLVGEYSTPRRQDDQIVRHQKEDREKR